MVKNEVDICSKVPTIANSMYWSCQGQKTTAKQQNIKKIEQWNIVEELFTTILTEHRTKQKSRVRIKR